MKMKLPRTALRLFERQLKSPNSGLYRPRIASRCTGSRSCPAPAPVGRRSYATVSAAELEFGQPVHETHPHILKAGEITPGITAQEYADRRARLALSLADGGVAILPASDLKYRSGAVFFPFRQESNFQYLTGFLEPESVAIITKTGPSYGDYEFHLFCRPKDPKAEQWSGPWSGLAAATDIFNADQAWDFYHLDTELPKLLRSAGRIYTSIDLSSPSSPSSSSSSNPTTTAAQVASVLSMSNNVSPLQPLVNQLRAVKSPAEITLMRAAGRASGRSITNAMRYAWTKEKDLHNYLDYEFTKQGCDTWAYVPVVAGGARGCMIHYVHNTAALDAGDLVLVDAGGEYGGYVTDITRTWPVDGKFTDAQKDLYQAVLDAQRLGVGLCREDSGLTLDAIHRAVEAKLAEGLTQIGFDLDQGLLGGRRNAMNTLFPHHVGHYVGLDVHDVPGYGRSIPLKKGHCVTIEPGVYVPLDDDRWPRHFRGMAVRIEDSVCVDTDSPLVLTTEAVKEIVDIEALRS
ncbi:peptidase M24, structural domain-containing protein [Diplogelasinospora grovesii]|uniref:Xaa-Pro aminopeptidase n=1 Tax=Diplogelasinospora grovesii TaxID=303347 RepID=A0AAN6N5Q3_9PEZI|nr:peptidase M24, structural domain-containing protein [Diplogelasinospora grovesii]